MGADARMRPWVGMRSPRRERPSSSRQVSAGVYNCCHHRHPRPAGAAILRRWPSVCAARFCHRRAVVPSVTTGGGPVRHVGGGGHRAATPIGLDTGWAERLPVICWRPRRLGWYADVCCLAARRALRSGGPSWVHAGTRAAPGGGRSGDTGAEGVAATWLAVGGCARTPPWEGTGWGDGGQDGGDRLGKAGGRREL